MENKTYFSPPAIQVYGKQSIFMENKAYSSSPAIQVYGKQSIF
jgi:hypothetical protein